jgi:predicted negative regulator of RcsB-dependent stress response
MRARGTILVIFVLLIVAAVFAWKIFNPGPMAFAGGSTVALADYRAADPTGVPADLANAEVVKRGEYLALAADCRACHTV